MANRETADSYLSGNVRAKLVVAQAAERFDSAYQRNVEALREVQPKDLEPGEIEARLGSSWIPSSDIREFVTELLDVTTSSVKIGYAEAIATWIVEPDYAAKYVVSNTTTYGTARFRATDLIEQSLNGRTPTAYDEDAEVITSILAAGVCAVLVILRKRLSPWASPILYGVAGLTAVILCYASFQAMSFISSRKPLSNDDAKRAVREWVDDFHTTVENVDDPKARFNFAIKGYTGYTVHVAQPIYRPEYIDFLAYLTFNYDAKGISEKNKFLILGDLGQALLSIGLNRTSFILSLYKLVLNCIS